MEETFFTLLEVFFILPGSWPFIWVKTQAEGSLIFIPLAILVSLAQYIIIIGLIAYWVSKHISFH